MFVCLFGCVDRVVESGLVYLRKNKINKLNFLGTYVSDFSDFLFIICIVEYNKLFDSDFFFLFFFFFVFFLLFCYYGIKSCNPSSYFGIGIVHQMWPSRSGEKDYVMWILWSNIFKSGFSYFSTNYIIHKGRLKWDVITKWNNPKWCLFKKK